MAKNPKTAHAGGNLRTPAQPSQYVPRHYIRRKARQLLLRAAMRGKVSWSLALPLLNKIGGGAQ